MVIGAGVAGLGSALALSRAGHQVTLVERDATPLPADPDAAFEWDRRGAPQVRHSHALLARLRNLLRDRYPDVLDALLDAGATEMRFADNLPVEITDREPAPGRRRPRRPGLPAHHLRVGAAPRGAGRRRASSCSTGSPVEGLRRRRRPPSGGRRGSPAWSSPALTASRAARSTPTSWSAAVGRRSAVPALAREPSASIRRPPTEDTGHRLPLALLPAARRTPNCPTSDGPDRRRPRLPQVRRVPGRQPHVLGHLRRAHRRRRAALAAARPRRLRPGGRHACPTTAAVGRARPGRADHRRCT